LGNIYGRGFLMLIFRYGYDWKIDEAQKNVLRTHTTAVSAQQLYLLAKNGFRPAKMFSIDRVFRNETLDATHLAEVGDF
jgi:phenylalanyl-tRNA synthetase alpha chain